MITNKTMKLRRNAMKTLKLLVLLGALPITVHAASILGSLDEMPRNITVNLNEADAFAYYGIIGIGDFNNDTYGAVTTDSANIGEFSRLTLTLTPSGVQGGFRTTTSLPLTISYSNATYDGSSSTYNRPAQTDVAGTKVGTYIRYGQDGYTLSLTTTLFAPEETISFYLLNYNAKANLSATLTGADSASAEYSLNDQVLPTLDANASAGTGIGNTFGILTLTVSGNIGDTLTFVNEIETFGITGLGDPSVGIAAVTAWAIPIPEPGTWALIVVGLGTLIGCRRLRG
ncbi:MAG: PEP-CTERM sorting domain-containing protein [Verrucomicrobiales bacterium]|jgi:hypothetical protein|nr:PEP-CTERM sorting domain-containing protein [Verrucomicrobiales bacterium]